MLLSLARQLVGIVLDVVALLETPMGQATPVIAELEVQAGEVRVAINRLRQANAGQVVLEAGELERLRAVSAALGASLALVAPPAPVTPAAGEVVADGVAVPAEQPAQ